MQGALLFPGHRAGASLKPCSIPAVAAVRGSPLFPGHRAGASLKHVALDVAVGECGCDLFPGHRAGASLKRVVLVEVRARAITSSPATEPGPH